MAWFVRDIWHKTTLVVFQNCVKLHLPNGSWNFFGTISKYHSWYLCQKSVQIKLLPIQIPETLSVEAWTNLLCDVYYLQKLIVHFYPNDLVNTRTTSPPLVSWSMHSTGCIPQRFASRYIAVPTSIHFPFEGY